MFAAITRQSRTQMSAFMLYLEFREGDNMKTNENVRQYDTIRYIGNISRASKN